MSINKKNIEFQNISEAYIKYFPGHKVLYVIPGISVASRTNSYMKNFYAPILNNHTEFIIKNIRYWHYPLLLIKLLAGEKSIIHQHWYDFSSIKSFLLLIWKHFWFMLYRLFGGHIVWTVHNKYPHNKKYISANKILRKHLAKITERIHVHCDSAVEIMSEILNVPKDKFFIVKHPPYDAEIISKKMSIELLAKKYMLTNVSETEKIFLMFGQIAEYKGIIEVINIIKNCNFNKRLLIVGTLKGGNELYYEKMLKSTLDVGNINIVCKFIPDSDVQYFINAADILVFNYNDILTSGGVLLALSYNKIVFAPNIGCISDIESDNLLKFNSYAELTKLIEHN